MNERLTEIDKEYSPDGACVLRASANPNDILGRLAALEDLADQAGGFDALRDLVQAKEEGRVVVLPCKVGDTLYLCATHPAKEARSLLVKSISINVHGNFLVYAGNRVVFMDDFGKKIFATREEAERAMEIMKSPAHGGENTRNDLPSISQQ